MGSSSRLAAIGVQSRGLRDAIAMSASEDQQVPSRPSDTDTPHAGRLVNHARNASTTLCNALRSTPSPIRDRSPGPVSAGRESHRLPFSPAVAKVIRPRRYSPLAPILFPVLTLLMAPLCSFVADFGR